MDLTKTYSTDEIQERYILEVLREVAISLEKKGYNPVNQIVGYLISGDPGYITSYEEARNKIQSIERSRILEALVKEHLN